MNNELEELYREVILDHSRRPRNFGELPDATVRVRGDNPACGDEIDVALKFGDDGRLEQVKFTGHGCAISQASASMMTAKVKNKGRDEASSMLRAFENLILGNGSNDSRMLGDLQFLAGVRKFPQRVKCAMLAWRALEQALRQGEGDATVSTEIEK